MEEYCLFLFQLWFRFDDGAEDEPLPVTQSSHQPSIVFGQDQISPTNQLHLSVMVQLALGKQG